METWEGGHVNAFIPIFLNFLRGMETPLVVSRPPGPLLFLNFLRGMETLAHERDLQALNFSS